MPVRNSFIATADAIADLMKARNLKRARISTKTLKQIGGRKLLSIGFLHSLKNALDQRHHIGFAKLETGGFGLIDADSLASAPLIGEEVPPKENPRLKWTCRFCTAPYEAEQDEYTKYSCGTIISEIPGSTPHRTHTCRAQQKQNDNQPSSETVQKVQPETTDTSAGPIDRDSREDSDLWGSKVGFPDSDPSRTS